MTNERAAVAARVEVADISGRESDFNLDNCGFQLCRHESTSLCSDDGYHDTAMIIRDYFPECEQLLKDV